MIMFPLTESYNYQTLQRNQIISKTLTAQRLLYRLLTYLPTQPIHPFCCALLCWCTYRIVASLTKTVTNCQIRPSSHRCWNFSLWLLTSLCFLYSIPFLMSTFIFTILYDEWICLYVWCTLWGNIFIINSHTSPSQAS